MELAQIIDDFGREMVMMFTKAVSDPLFRAEVNLALLVNVASKSC
jgi:hypothetical protein